MAVTFERDSHCASVNSDYGGVHDDDDYDTYNEIESRC